MYRHTNYAGSVDGASCSGIYGLGWLTQPLKHSYRVCCGWRQPDRLCYRQWIPRGRRRLYGDNGFHASRCYSSRLTRTAFHIPFKSVSNLGIYARISGPGLVVPKSDYAHLRSTGGTNYHGNVDGYVVPASMGWVADRKPLTLQSSCRCGWRDPDRQYTAGASGRMSALSRRQWLAWIQPADPLPTRTVSLIHTRSSMNSQPSGAGSPITLTCGSSPTPSYIGLGRLLQLCRLAGWIPTAIGLTRRLLSPSTMVGSQIA